ncbi:hypothetical protein [Rhodopila sp.]|uniref:hypothetical protein n=1 Tax=Rhodopila sp. TaxID=2480087 RepID=UPI003D0F0CDA
MTNPTVATPDNNAPGNNGTLPADPVFGLIECLANRLAPLFVAGRDDLPVAQAMAVCAIASYQPRTHADCINSARVIAFSMAALAALGRAASEDMPPALQLRYLGKANTLNRSAAQGERLMERRQRDLRSKSLGIPPGAPDEKTPPPMTAGGLAADLAVINAAVAEAMQEPVGDSIPAPAPAATATGPAAAEISPAVAAKTTRKAATETTHCPVAMPQATPAAPRLPVVRPMPVIQLDQRPNFAQRMADELVRTAALQRRALAATTPSVV